jgi:hypothetical protein
MHFNDKPEFRKKLVEMATVVGRTITADEVDPYFKQLEEYPINLLAKAMDKALRDRDPSDVFIKNTLVTVPEIRTAIEDLARPAEGEVGLIASCKLCSTAGWIMGFDKEKRAIAWPCKCLYESCKATLDNKASAANSHRKRIIKAYEYHQKNWGDNES